MTAAPIWGSTGHALGMQTCSSSHHADLLKLISRRLAQAHITSEFTTLNEPRKSNMRWFSLVLVTFAVLGQGLAQTDDDTKDSGKKSGGKKPGGKQGSTSTDPKIFTGNTCGCLAGPIEDHDCKLVFVSDDSKKLCAKYGAKQHVRGDNQVNCAYGTTGLANLLNFSQDCIDLGADGAMCCDAGTSDSGCKINTSKPKSNKKCD
ncbi:hypothetical protein AC579_981 [Pseudocercospora musae]|uniref:Uncharacterized protein n=1 Tax=Pseudocercospora musae TaxID=113226 RepID=A0A139I1M2_9PEZI|nr:hypothetical protein AC579_981 [Pseudocercospora musae]